MIRESGKMWGPDGELYDTKALIPDRSYSGVFQATIEDCKKNGAYDPAKMGTVQNIGLMAKKAEEYGSHDKTLFLDERKSPSRVVNEIDNRGSRFYLATYWAQALAAQTDDAALAERFKKVAQALAENEGKINDELMAAQGKAVDTGDYYLPDNDKVSKAMRPSATLNAIIDAT